MCIRDSAGAETSTLTMPFSTRTAKRSSGRGAGGGRTSPRRLYLGALERVALINISGATGPDYELETDICF